MTVVPVKGRSMKVAIYARVSTEEQSCENQLIELRRYAEARGWAIFKEYVDEGVSGSKDRRPRSTSFSRMRGADGSVCWSARSSIAWGGACDT